MKAAHGAKQPSVPRLAHPLPNGRRTGPCAHFCREGRNHALKISQVALSQNDRGLMQAVLAPTAAIRSRTSRAINSGPLSDHTYSGRPRSMDQSVSTSSTSEQSNLRSTRIIRAALVYSWTVLSIRLTRPSAVRTCRNIDAISSGVSRFPAVADPPVLRGKPSQLVDHFQALLHDATNDRCPPTQREPPFKTTDGYRSASGWEQPTTTATPTFTLL